MASRSQRFGRGDVNGDGYDNLIVGALRWIADAALASTAGEMHFDAAGADLLGQADIDSEGVADSEVTRADSATLTAADFILSPRRRPPRMGARQRRFQIRKSGFLDLGKPHKLLKRRHIQGY
ncbi:MAG: hypothetical protein KDK53_11070 [Maritimibacter sp.]|nr:hypothetical protein [Maritimibacter sp.]